MQTLSAIFFLANHNPLIRKQEGGCGGGYHSAKILGLKILQINGGGRWGRAHNGRIS